MKTIKDSWLNAEKIEYPNKVFTLWNYNIGRVAIFTENNVGRIFDIKQQNIEAEKYLNKLVRKNERKQNR